LRYVARTIWCVIQQHILDVQGLFTLNLKNSIRISPHTSDLTFHSFLVLVPGERYQGHNPCTLLIFQLLVFRVDGYANIAFSINMFCFGYCISLWLQYMLCQKSPLTGPIWSKANLKWATGVPK
jgi:hypothetical protein